MEASKKMLCAMAIAILLLVECAQATCSVKNSSSDDILLLPVGTPKIKIKVKAGDLVKVPTTYLVVVIKNLATGHKSVPTKLTDGTVVVCVDGIVKGTVDMYLGGVLDGIISIVQGKVIALGV